MQGSILPLIDTMISHGVGHHAKELIMFDQFIDQHFEVLVMYIVVAGAMHDQEISPQVFGMIQG